MKKIAITVGDPAGVGPEIIESWARGYEAGDCVEIIAHKELLDKLPDSFSKRQVGASEYLAKVGMPDSEGAKIAFDALEAAASGCMEGRYCSVATAPISKSEMRRVGFDFAGQTEFFAARWGGDPVMAFSGLHFIVALATWHIPLKDVPSALNFGNISRAAEAAKNLARKSLNIAEPRIAVCGLNPHAGEGGIIGLEEIEIINPILERLKASGEYPNLSMCLPPDTVFERAAKGEFDAIVSLYHDQGLGPLKAVDFDNAVNISMNLPFCRTSPDHGTGFSIAGKEIASSNSFARAVELARLLGR